MVCGMEMEAELKTTTTRKQTKEFYQEQIKGTHLAAWLGWSGIHTADNWQHKKNCQDCNLAMAL